MEKVIILDGAMGTELQRAGLKMGENPEVFAMQNPDILSGIHQRYIDAGSRMIYSCTFGANSHKLSRTGHSTEEVIKANVKTAREVADKNSTVSKTVKVALDLGPIGELLAPLGTLKFETVYEMYKEEAVAGEGAGADIAVVETLTDLYEAKAAVLAIKENTNLPVWVTMTFEENGRTFLGSSVPCVAQTLTSLGADALGINCSLGPAEINPLIEEMRDWTDLPLIVKPNAGLPDPKTGEYALGASDFAEQMRPYMKLGVTAVGGCCGTTPEFIREVSRVYEDAERPSEEERRSSRAGRRGVCSAGYMVELDGCVHVIGERINPTGKKRFQQALKDHDIDEVLKIAIAQQDAGAEVLDINVGVPGINEVQMMKEVVEAVQGVVSIPLQIDSPNPEAVEAGLRIVNGRAIVNSVNGEAEKQKQILPIVRKYGAAVIGLTMDESGLAKTADDRVRIATQIRDACREYGIPDEDILIDCLTLTVSAQQDQAMETLEGVRRVRRELGLHTTLGVSNISFGLPERGLITRSFLTQAMFCGLDFPIINPSSQAIMDTVASFRALSGEDEHCMKYIERMADPERKTMVEKAGGSGSNGAGSAGSSGCFGGNAEAGCSAGSSLSSSALSEDAEDTPRARMERAILKGLKKETRDLTVALLEDMSGMEIINTMIIPALDLVGEQYEKQILFLPQMINAADAACAGLDYIKAQIGSSGDSVSKGKIVIATVEGDIHDIGKNIVKIVLENYGYDVIDLGRDVPVQKVLDTVLDLDAKLVGLSALMTTTTVSMKKTIEALRESGSDCKVMVGGAVMTQEYADEMGADFYVPDAKASVDAAKSVLG